MGMKDRLLAEAFAVLPRILGLCDRIEDSPTYGCCDRPYWHYRQADFANARFQEAGLLFALAAQCRPEFHRFAGVPRLARWSRAAWRFWLARRNGDGSLPESYPADRSFCATAFSAAAFAETVGLLGGAAAWSEELAAAEPTFAWLASHGNPEVANQHAASLQALAAYAALTGEARYARAARLRRDEVLGLADDGGAFPEYGGFDAGYQSIAMAVLVRTMRWLGRDEKIEAVLGKGSALLEACVGADGRVDAEANSRRTQFIYPSSLVHARSPVLARIVKGLDQSAILRPAWMDDRYCTPFAIDYFLAAMEVDPCR